MPKKDDDKLSGGILDDYLSDGTNLYQKKDDAADKNKKTDVARSLSENRRMTLRHRRKNISSAVASAAFAARAYGSIHRFNMERMTIGNNDKNKLSLKERLSDIQAKQALKELPYRNDILLSGYLGDFKNEKSKLTTYFINRNAPVSGIPETRPALNPPEMVDPAGKNSWQDAFVNTAGKGGIFNAVNRTRELYVSVCQKENNTQAKSDMMSKLKKMEQKKTSSVLQARMKKAER